LTTSQQKEMLSMQLTGIHALIRRLICDEVDKVVVVVVVGIGIGAGWEGEVLTLTWVFVGCDDSVVGVSVWVVFWHKLSPVDFLVVFEVAGGSGVVVVVHDGGGGGGAIVVEVVVEVEVVVVVVVVVGCKVFDSKSVGSVIVFLYFCNFGRKRDRSIRSCQ